MDSFAQAFHRQKRNQQMKPGITVILTSCRRAALLERTIDSFLRFNTSPITRFVVIEDSDDPSVPSLISTKYKGQIELIVNNPRLGQIKSIDLAYSTVDTEYIFHCEDDWEFFRAGFIEDSISVLSMNSSIHQVQLRDLWDNNGHPPERSRYITRDGVCFRLLSTGYRTREGTTWHGFSFNPGLRRTADYTAIGPYTNIGHEEQISAAYHLRGLKAAILEESAVEHIGDGFHVPDLGENRERSRLDKTWIALSPFVPPIIPKTARSIIRRYKQD